MCNRYETPTQIETERFWHLGRENAPALWPRAVFPRTPGPFIRRARDVAGYERGLVVGTWGLIPWFAKKPKLKFPTNNARSEELEAKASYKDPWKRGQRCIIPASTFDEPNWESGKNVWWQFKRADGDPWGLAGLWNSWIDKATGEVHESYTMLTINADDHPLMRRMHKPDPKAPPDKQDKRSVIPLEAELRSMARRHGRASERAHEASAGRDLRSWASEPTAFIAGGCRGVGSDGTDLTDLFRGTIRRCIGTAACLKQKVSINSHHFASLQLRRSFFITRRKRSN